MHGVSDGGGQQQRSLYHINSRVGRACRAVDGGRLVESVGAWCGVSLAVVCCYRLSSAVAEGTSGMRQLVVGGERRRTEWWW